MKLARDFYLRGDVVEISMDLLGKFLFTEMSGIICSGMIVETEAYAGISDRASHAFGGKFTDRTRVMYMEGGTSYVYLCYGIHHLFNVVTNIEGIPHAILIRAIEPIKGVKQMLRRREKSDLDRTLTSGPGSLSAALGITVKNSGISLLDKTIWIEDQGVNIKRKDIISSPRVGVSYAKEDSLLPYRFRIKNNPWTSIAK